ncbi:3-deoxy-D-manno-octulosonic acid transferase [Granulicella sp. 5B5]|uniref:3-deoxy-D-manno-octulosonic acid transferase n=1 Tax=Granulicella sp. 5B5 TaxID=1617967 RepID=UPI0015F65F17|nr:3-deoxy-D-manno-octulosonic acid transferase [Granulicella sp. 5B5]QMV20375.1 3-deoxy-D-manno-octulosonic acid transferase [Granulicella sp. 5B5]
MLLYSAVLLVGLVIASPWWLLRMVTTERYREGLGQRLGRVPVLLREAVRGRQVVWVHAVSVGEVLAATRLVAELEAALGDGWVVVVSTTTRTGQALARVRFGAARVFYYPLDFAWAVRAYLKALEPAMLVLMESELWPRMLHECRKSGVPVAVVNARVSDRSFARGMRVRKVWGRALRGVSLWLAQSEEDARRLVAMGVTPGSVVVSGNLKFDVRAARESRVAALIKEAAAGRPVVVAGSTLDRTKESTLSEEEIVIQAWEGSLRCEMDALLVIAPRHPERFGEVEAIAMEFTLQRVSSWILQGGETHTSGAKAPFSSEAMRPEAEASGYLSVPGSSAGTQSSFHPTYDDEAVMNGAPSVSDMSELVEVIVLDTIGDLAAVYGVADVAFVGGSLVDRGGHNPLEPAQFGVPVVMGPHFQNFRSIVAAMQAADGIRIVSDTVELRNTLNELLRDRALAEAIGERGRRVFEAQQGATGRTVAALMAMCVKGRVRGE